MKIIDILGLSRQVDIIRQYDSSNQVKTITADISEISRLGWAPVADMDESLRDVVRFEMTRGGY
jgi:nucleoside-diphosphate-sugar epimerase